VLRTGEAPAGWFPVWDIRYFRGGLTAVVLHVAIIVILALVFSPDPWAFFVNEAMAVYYVIVLLVVGIGVIFLNQMSKTNQVATYGRNFRIEDMDTLVKDLVAAIPPQYHPVQRKSEPVDGFEDEDMREITLDLKEVADLTYQIQLVIKPRRHFVTVQVNVSDRDHRFTQDLLDVVREFFEARIMDWLSVDVVEDVSLLNVMRKREEDYWPWEVTTSTTSLSHAIYVMLLIIVIFWIFIGWAIVDPTTGWVMVVGAFGMMVNILLLILMTWVVSDLILALRQKVMFEYRKVFHASPWYVTVALEEAMDTAGWRYVNRQRVVPTSLTRSEFYRLMDLENSNVTVDITWDDHDTDPNWTCVRVRTSEEDEGVQTVKDLVRRAVYHRDLLPSR
jgi:hypothetical protein